MPGYKLTELGPIPAEWSVFELGDMDPYVTSGSRGWARYYSNYGSAFLRITNLSRQSIYPDLSDLRFVKIPLIDAEGRRTQLQEGDLLVSITADIGIIGYVDRSIPTPTYINQHVALVRFDPSRISSKFLCYFLASEKPQRLFRATTDQGAKAGMSLTGVRRIKAVLPPLPEQNAIAEALSDSDSLIESLVQLIDKKRQIKLGAMQELLTGNKRLPEFRGHWKGRELQELADIRSGGTPSTSQPQFWDGDVVWCTPTDITALRGRKYLQDSGRKITQAGVQNSSAEMIPARSIVMTSRATIGECAINVCPVTTNQGFKNLVPHEDVDVEFLYYLLQIQKKALVRLSGGSTFLEIGKAQLATFSVRMPLDKQEQVAIAAILADMDNELSILEDKLAKARVVKQGMMQELLTGRIRLV